MSNRLKPRKRRLDAPHVRFYRFELVSAAYRSLSVGARALLVELKALYNGRNNGDLFLSCRKAAERLNCSKSLAAELFLELCDRGFIRPKDLGAFSMKAAAGQGKATTWVLTEFPIGNAVQGTKEFMHWQPSNDGRKNHFTVHGGGQSVHGGGQLSAKAPQNTPNCPRGRTVSPDLEENRSTGADTDILTMGSRISGNAGKDPRKVSKLTRTGKAVLLRAPVRTLSALLIKNRATGAKPATVEDALQDQGASLPSRMVA